HEVVHNRYVVNSLRERGAIFIEDIGEVPDGSILIFSSHVVSQAVRAEAKARDLTMLFDALPLIFCRFAGRAEKALQHDQC
ncbi:hypothetical protein ACC771_23395, partial [Rhizobium ruizarguesonis]